MSYKPSGEVEVGRAMREETFLVTVGKRARQTRDIQTMGLEQTQYQERITQWVYQRTGAQLLNLKPVVVNAMEIRQAARQDLRYTKMGCRESMREIIVERFSELEVGGETRVHKRRSRSSHQRETLKEW